MPVKSGAYKHYKAGFSPKQQRRGDHPPFLSKCSLMWSGKMLQTTNMLWSKNRHPALILLLARTLQSDVITVLVYILLVKSLGWWSTAHTHTIILHTHTGPSPATITDTSLLPIILGVLVPIVLILLIVIILFLIAYCVLHSQRRETSTQVNLLQARVTELSTVYEDLDNNERMETIDNRAYKTVPPASSKLKELGEIPLPDAAYDVCRNSDD